EGCAADELAPGGPAQLGRLGALGPPLGAAPGRLGRPPPPLPQPPRGGGGPAPWDPRWGPHRAGWGYHRPLYHNQLGWRLPSGGPPGPGQASAGIALLLLLLSPVTILAWVAGQALLRATGLRWWNLALAAVMAVTVLVAIQGAPGPALAHHFAGYLWLAQQF